MTSFSQPKHSSVDHCPRIQHESKRISAEHNALFCSSSIIYEHPIVIDVIIPNFCLHPRSLSQKKMHYHTPNLGLTFKSDKSLVSIKSNQNSREIPIKPIYGIGNYDNHNAQNQKYEVCRPHKHSFHL